MEKLFFYYKCFRQTVEIFRLFRLIYSIVLQPLFFHHNRKRCIKKEENRTITIPRDRKYESSIFITEIDLFPSLTIHSLIVEYEKCTFKRQANGKKGEVKHERVAFLYNIKGNSEKMNYLTQGSVNI